MNSSWLLFPGKSSLSSEATSTLLRFSGSEGCLPPPCVPPMVEPPWSAHHPACFTCILVSVSFCFICFCVSLSGHLLSCRCCLPCYFPMFHFCLHINVGVLPVWICLCLLPVYVALTPCRKAGSIWEGLLQTLDLFLWVSLLPRPALLSLIPAQELVS